MKAGAAGAASGGKSAGGANSGGSTACVLKFLTPEALAAAIIGKGGVVIASIRQTCQAKVVLSDHGEVYPQTDCRVLTAQANTEESLNEVSKHIVAKLAELVKKSAAAEAVGQDGELKLRTLVPRAAVGGIIGKGGSSIKQMREASGAKITISDPVGNGPGADQLVSLIGPVEALEYVMTEVNKQIQMLKAEPWFTTWAASKGVVQAGFSQSASGAGGTLAMGPPGNYSPGIESMTRVAQSLPPYVMEDSRGFALSCVVPNHLVGGLIGRNGSGTKEVQNSTGTKISIREIPNDHDNRSLNITGPLSNTCTAYMLMMKRYLDAEAQASRTGRQRPQ